MKIAQNSYIKPLAAMGIFDHEGRGMETYLTIEELAGHLKLAAQTIRRYVLNREIPYHKIKKVVRFRLSEIEQWIDEGGGTPFGKPGEDLAGGLFADAETESGETAAGEIVLDETGEAETGEPGAGETAANETEPDSRGQA